MNRNSSCYVFLLACLWLQLSSCAVTRSNIAFPNDMDDPDNKLTTWAAAWSADGKYIATGGTDSTVRIYKASSLKLLYEFSFNSWIHRLHFHPEDPLLAIATHAYVKLLDLETRSIQSIDHHASTRTAGWNADGNLLGVADHDSEFRIWDKQGKLKALVKKTFTDPSRDPKSFLGMDWHPSENTAVVVSEDITFYDAHGKEIMVVDYPNPAAILCVDWHPSGNFFAIGDYGYNGEGENVPSLLHFINRNGQIEKSIDGSRAEYRNIAWNDDGTLLATASDVLRIWDTEGNLLYQSDTDGKNNLWGLSWHPDGRKLVTSSRFGDVTIWDDRARIIKKIREK